MDQGQEWPWSSTVADLERDQLINVIPYELNLDYDYWTYRMRLHFSDVDCSNLHTQTTLRARSCQLQKATRFHLALPT